MGVVLVAVGSDYDEIEKCINMEQGSNVLFRSSLVIYEFGNFVKSVVYSSRFPKDKQIHLSNAKLELSDLVTQLRMLGYYVVREDIRFNDDIPKTRGIPVIGDDDNVKISNYVCWLNTVTNSYIASIIDGVDSYAERSIDEKIKNGLYPLLQKYCSLYGWNPNEIEHLGVVRAIERYADFKDNGWVDLEI